MSVGFAHQLERDSIPHARLQKCRGESNFSLSASLAPKNASLSPLVVRDSPDCSNRAGPPTMLLLYPPRRDSQRVPDWAAQRSTVYLPSLLKFETLVRLCLIGL